MHTPDNDRCRRPTKGGAGRRAPERSAGWRIGLLVGLLAMTGWAAGLRAESPLADAAAAGDGVNRVAMLSHGYDALLLRVHLIRTAKTSIDVQTFIWANDECGRLVMCELIEAARRGVKVRIIADHMFSAQEPATAAFLATVSPNLELKHYRPALSRMKGSFFRTALASLQSFHDVNQRMHSKVMLFDGAILITGGRNIENAYFDHATELNYRDRDVLATGPLTRDVAATFEEFWDFRHAVPSRELKDVAELLASGAYRRYETRADYDFGSYFGAMNREADDDALVAQRFAAKLRPVQRAAFVADEPGKPRHALDRTARLTRELKITIQQARSSVVIQTPYLVLSKPAQALFRDVQRRNPELRIRISSNSFASTDNIMAYSANYRLRTRYVADLNLEVHEFKPQPAALPELFTRHEEIRALARTRIAEGRQTRLPFLCLHAKSLVVDDRIAFVGSYNLDPRSENLNTEVGLLVEDAAFARELREEIETDMRPENSWTIARRAIPLKLDSVNGLIGGVLALGPVDLWPIQNTSSFELIPEGRPVTPRDVDFHKNYREVGPFPGTEGLFTTKEILTRLYKAVGSPLTPIL